MALLLLCIWSWHCYYCVFCHLLIFICLFGILTWCWWIWCYCLLGTDADRSILLFRLSDGSAVIVYLVLTLLLFLSFVFYWNLFVFWVFWPDTDRSDVIVYSILMLIDLVLCPLSFCWWICCYCVFFHFSHQLLICLISWDCVAVNKQNRKQIISGHSWSQFVFDLSGIS